MQKKHKMPLRALCLTTLLVVSSNPSRAASNFTIVPTPGLPFPTKNYPGSMVFAYYTVTNQTNTTRSGYRLQGLPSTVVQNTSSASYCPNPITLGGHASCILLLDIIGNVESNFALCNGANCTIASVPLNITLPSTALPMIAAGYYTPADSTHLPLLALSQNNGAHWTYPSEITAPAQPSSVVSGELSGGASCNGMICIAAGFYTVDGATRIPLLALSQDSGATWTYPSDITNPSLLPSSSSSGQLIGGASCAGRICIATGTYLSGIRSRPLLALTTNNGTTWTYPSEITSKALSLAGFRSGLLIGGASCNGEVCIATGYYTSTGHPTPLLALSQDSGTTWTYPDEITSTALPSNFMYGRLTGGASCSGTTCIAAGFYNDGTTQYSLLALSMDNGTTWTYPSAIQSALPTNASVSQLTGGASCNGTTCIAAGFYSDLSLIDHPLLALSTDNGSTWTYPSDITSKELTGGGKLGGGASCSGTICVAAGSSGSLTKQPLLALSTDNGATWTYPSDIQTALPLGQGDLNGGASCNGTTCMAAGRYSVDGGTTYLPLLALSTDNGATWSYPSDISLTSSLPSPFTSGDLDGGASVSAASLFPDSLEFLSDSQDIH